eukprot:2296573-Amphidinium_carterae.1
MSYNLRERLCIAGAHPPALTVSTFRLPRAIVWPPVGLARVGGPGFFASPIRSHGLVWLKKGGTTRPRQGGLHEPKWRKGEKKPFKGFPESAPFPLFEPDTESTNWPRQARSRHRSAAKEIRPRQDFLFLHSAFPDGRFVPLRFFWVALLFRRWGGEREGAGGGLASLPLPLLLLVSFIRPNLDFGAISGKLCPPVCRWRPAKWKRTIRVENEPEKVSFLGRGIPLVP